jgi:alpha-ketoglutarate-dependent taurine dioxygenase
VNEDEAMSSVLQENKTPFVRIDLKPRIASELKIDKATLLSGVASTDIRALLEERGVVVVRQVNLTDAEQIAFTKTLGPIVNENKDKISKITIDPVENPKGSYIRGAFFWHIDGTMLPHPIGAAVLTAHRLAPTGGDTEFCNTYAAYDDLPESEKVQLEKLKVVHSIENTQRYFNPEPTYEELKEWQEFPDRILPLVWKHRSGRKSLVLGNTATYVVGMGPRDSSALLTRLRDWATQSQFVYRHKWTVGDMVIWDNSGTMHRATLYALDSGRMMHRTQTAGEEPIT